MVKSKGQRAGWVLFIGVVVAVTPWSSVPGSQKFRRSFFEILYFNMMIVVFCFFCCHLINVSSCWGRRDFPNAKVKRPKHEGKTHMMNGGNLVCHLKLSSLKIAFLSLYVYKFLVLDPWESTVGALEYGDPLLSLYCASCPSHRGQQIPA